MVIANPVESLIQTIPELDSVIEHGDRDLPYIAYGAWAIHIGESLERPDHKDFIERSIDFMNTMASSHDDQTINLLQVGVLEVLLDFAKGRSLIETYGNQALRACADEIKSGV